MAETGPRFHPVREFALIAVLAEKAVAKKIAAGWR